MPLRPLHCFAYRRHGIWEAICLDLNISVRGETREAVKSALANEVDAHIVAVGAAGGRRAPWTVRLRCHARFVLASVFRPHQVPAEHEEFILARSLGESR